MTNIIAIAISVYAALTPVKVHVDGAGYMRFVRDGRVVYAKTATFVSIDGSLGSEGAKLLPEIPVPTTAPTITVDLQGNVDAHHDVLRFRWQLAKPAVPEPTAIGFDVAVLEGGRIAQVCGFLDKAPTAA